MPLTAAGAAGLLKILMALKHHTLPPTANFERSSPQLGLEDSPFRVLTRAEPWPTPNPGHPRRAAISGFGFGGINAHVLIEEWEPEPSGTPRARSGGTPARGTAFQAVGIPHGQDARATSAGEPAPIAIVGLAAQVGTLEGREASRRTGLRVRRPSGRSSHPLAGVAGRPVPHPAEGTRRDAAPAIADAPGGGRGDPRCRLGPTARLCARAS